MSVLLSAIKLKTHAKPVKTDKEIAACLAPQTIMSVLLPAIKPKAHAKPVKTDKKIVACLDSSNHHVSFIACNKTEGTRKTS